jgi:methionyl-tRNA synthetase
VYAIGDLLAPLQVDARLQRPPSHGLGRLRPARRERRHRARRHPAIWTYENIDNMRAQLRKMGISYDWDRESRPATPRTTSGQQLIFIKMLERGLAYRKRSSVNWCPSCQTVLANEQVEAGRCWRCDSEVTKREIDGWFFKITDYAEELLAWCDRLPGLARARDDDAAQLDRQERRAPSSICRWPAARSSRSACSPRARHRVRHDVRRAGARAPAGRFARRPTTTSARA